ncbi:MAG: hypothetical protein LUD68_03615 [Rikenellaceae bacterium]|nr:hypothetical protein [Rikenellaceae bacterium]
MLIAFFGWASCQQEDSLSEKSSPQEAIVTEARAYFKQAVKEAFSRGILVQDPNLGSPGEVTPRWEKAIVKTEKDTRSIYVPLYVQHYYLAREQVLRDSIERTYHVPVYPLLCITVDRSGAFEGTYLTLIPSKGYYSTHKNSVVERYLKNEGVYGKFYRPGSVYRYGHFPIAGCGQSDRRPV